MDEDCATYFIYFLAILVAIGFAGQGLFWVYQHHLPYLIMAAATLCGILVFRLRKGRRGKTSAAPRALVAQAARAEQSLARARESLERESQALANIQFRAHDEVNFQVHKQAHRESRIIADRWHAHKRTALKARRSISGGLNRMRDKNRRLERDLNSATPRRRRALTREIQGTRSAVEALSRGLTTLNAEVDRGTRSLTTYNQRTAALREHIRNHCGPQGRRWYERLEARKRKIIGA
ncbi:MULTISPECIES: hypothetical protein [unclassified Streptomyces]|uniref:hypothetical protein n=1 Tax=unclassified Streptomyces TaxID=2593676 RepID=UPI002ED09357|nr:hypothetical protein OH827_11550 [Streptomyces sp. NBC_00891]WSY05607.1 hypothetical protein OG464_11550 [Streptomyces sp. NBC_00890]WSZ07231.1 hypothetical protein OG704_11550 [Streptomyces sp. NBC_00869]WSZ25270.1 hypothetical protein OG498_22015 [Streptomyces sp. NBC_00870]